MPLLTKNVLVLDLISVSSYSLQCEACSSIEFRHLEHAQSSGLFVCQNVALGNGSLFRFLPFPIYILDVCKGWEKGAKGRLYAGLVSLGSMQDWVLGQRILGACHVCHYSHVSVCLCGEKLFCLFVLFQEFGRILRVVNLVSEQNLNGAVAEL